MPDGTACGAEKIDDHYLAHRDASNGRAVLRLLGSSDPRQRLWGETASSQPLSQLLNHRMRHRSGYRLAPRCAALLTIALIGTLSLACGNTGEAASGSQSGSQPQASSGSSTPATDACSLLLPAEIETATGLSWGDGALNESLSAAERSVCDWYTAGAEYASVQVMIVTTTSAFEDNRVSAADVFGLTQGSLAIPGADDAYATSEGSLIGMDIDDSFVQVTFIPPGPGEVLSATLELARLVAGRL